MRFFAVLLTLSVGLGCAGSSAPREATSPDNEDNEEVTEPQSEDSEQPAEADEDSDEPKEEGSRPAKKRRPPKRRKHVQAAPEPEAPPMYRKPLPPPPVAAPPPEEPAAAPAYSEGADQGDTTLEGEARQRCRWKNVAPYRPEWANAITPPLAQQRKITSKPICPYGTPPAVVRVARQIAAQQTKFKR